MSYGQRVTFFTDVNLDCLNLNRNKETINNRSGKIAHPMPIGCAPTRKSAGAHIFPSKKKTLEVQVFNRISKTMKMLQRVPNTVMNISVLEYFDNVYISDGVKTALSTHGLGNI